MSLIVTTLTGMKFTLAQVVRVAFAWDAEAFRISETSWLNGMRGLAAFAVMMDHYSLLWLTFIAEAPFGSLVLQDQTFHAALYFRAGTRLWAPWRFPLLRILMVNGGGQVALFFVISGFVLTWTALQLAEARHLHKLFESLGSSVARRWSRLYLPCVVVNFIYSIDQAIQDEKDLLWSAWIYIGEGIAWINPFRTLAENRMSDVQMYNGVVWTIPFEFSGSIFVYVLVLMLGRYSYSRRLGMMLIAVTSAFFSLKWHLWLFGSGMILADYTRHAGLLNGDRPRSTTSNALWSLSLLCGLLVLSLPVPNPAWYTRPGYDVEVYIPLPPGWRKDVGAERLFWGVGAIVAIASACHLRLVRRFYELSFLQYLGKISFMLYLIHPMFQNHIGSNVQNAAYAAFCNYEMDNSEGAKKCHINSLLHVAILMALYLVTIPLVFLASSNLERLVDRPIAALGKRIDQLLLWKSTPQMQDMVATVPEEELLLACPVSNGELELGSVERSS